MRIAVINWSRRRVGGVETYLNTLIPELARAGHEVAFWHEIDEPAGRELIGLPDESPAWCAAEMGAARALTALREWRPDVIYAHKVSDPELEAELLTVAPSIFFAHDYNGTCISGTKTFKTPVVQPCARRFGWQCLLHYYPHRCGGLSPVTMLRLYRLQAKRLENLRRYEAIVTHSDHMFSELIKHGLSPQRAYNFPYYVQQVKSADVLSSPAQEAGASALRTAQSSGSTPNGDARTHWRLLFSGRMEDLKGGDVFIDALPQVAARLKRPLRVTFAGDGRKRQAWEQRASRRRASELEIEFVGWVGRQQINRLLEASDLLVMPSLWPEPFGLVGPEAGLYGVPVAAFAVGGIPDWLVNGVNGYLAPGDPPTSDGLAAAIVNCLRDPLMHERLRRGAFEAARQFNIKNHLTALLEVFSNVLSRQ